VIFLLLPSVFLVIFENNRYFRQSGCVLRNKVRLSCVSAAFLTPAGHDYFGQNRWSDSVSLKDETCDDEVTGYCIGAIGRVTELHAMVYHHLCGFDVNFEIFVAKEFADFQANFNALHDGLWLYKRNNRIVGCIAIDGSRHGAEGARLRFLIVDPECQQSGIGKTLMKEAIEFCRSRLMRRIFLWTTPALDQARLLYEKFGFVLTTEVPHEDWGKATVHQKFELILQELNQ
jgi:N-acetylglutamate synthase-like GNAT family acetyltransferase